MIQEHQVRERAYFIWQSTGGDAGSAESHWAQAEAELRATLMVRHVASDASIAPSPVTTLKTAKAAKPAAKADAAKAQAKSKKAPRAAAAH